MTERTPFTVEDLYQLGWLEEPRVSPDGRLVAYVRLTVDRVGNRYRRAIWLAPTDGGAPRRLTSGLKSDTTPRWSPDGRRLAFVSDREDEARQIYVIAVDGGEARRITRLQQGAAEPAWSPDGRRIAFVGRASEAERAAEDQAERHRMHVRARPQRRDRDRCGHEDRREREQQRRSVPDAERATAVRRQAQRQHTGDHVVRLGERPLRPELRQPVEREDRGRHRPQDRAAAQARGIHGCLSDVSSPVHP